jgi:hypothetical protein
MPFTPKDWQNYPNTTTPISDAALEDLEVRVTNYADLVGGSTFTDLTKDPYNCDFTGAADCAPAITQAITDAFAGTTSKTLYAPQGIYKLLSALPWRSGLRLIGDGMFGRTIFRPTGQDPTTAPGLRFISWDTTNGTTFASPLTGVEFRDFEVDGSSVTAPASGVATSKGFHLQHVRNARFQNVYVHDCGQTGFGVDFPQLSVVFSHCFAQANGRLNDGATIGGNGFGIGLHGSDTVREPVLIQGSYAIGNKRYGIILEMLGGSAVGTAVFTNGPRVIGNYCHSNQVGIGDAGARRALIEGNTCILSSVAGISVDSGTQGSPNGKPGYEGLIIGNQVYDNTGHGVRLNFTGAGTPDGRYAIIGNEIATSTGNGIAVMLDTVNLDNLRIADNLVHDNQLSGVRVWGAGATNTAHLFWSEIVSNMVWNNGRAATAGDRDGIRLGSQCDQTRIENNWIFDRATTKLQSLGLTTTANFNSGSIRNNDFRGNLDGGWAMDPFINAAVALGSNLGGSEGTLGLDQPPPVAETPTASPWTRAEKSFPEVLYVFGGTVSSITIQGVQVANGSGVTLLIEPGDQPVVTYSVIPTVRARRRI